MAEPGYHAEPPARARAKRAGAESFARDDQRGVALLVAMLAVALLTVTVLELTYSTQVHYRRAAHWLAAKRARLAAESGVALASEVLSFDGELAELAAGANLPEGAAPMLQGLDPRLATVDGFVDLWARCVEPGPWSCKADVGSECTLPIGASSSFAESGVTPGGQDDSFTVRIEDETGLYNLNRLSTHLSSSAEEMTRVIRMLRLAGLDPALAGPIVDWVDRDGAPASFPPGAEASQYAAQDFDHVPRNAPLATFRELALVLGVGARELRELRRVATVLPATVLKVNVNTAPPAVLQALSDTFTEGTLAALHAQRCTKPFVDQTDLVERVPELAGAGAGILSLLGYASEWFRVRSTASVGDVKQSVEAVLYRRGADVQVTYFASRRGANVSDASTRAAEAIDDGFGGAQGFDLPAPATPRDAGRT